MSLNHFVCLFFFPGITKGSTLAQNTFCKYSTRCHPKEVQNFAQTSRPDSRLVLPSITAPASLYGEPHKAAAGTFPTSPASPLGEAPSPEGTASTDGATAHGGAAGLPPPAVGDGASRPARGLTGAACEVRVSTGSELKAFEASTDVLYAKTTTASRNHPHTSAF